MTAKELYDHITKHMSAEEALLKLMEGTIRNYEHLKFKDGEELHPVMVIVAATLDMGWSMMLTNEDLDSDLDGMIIGTEDYIKSLTDSDEPDCNCDCDCDEFCKN